MKNIIIFGAASAIAQATARLLAKDQAHFILLDHNQDRLDIVAKDLEVRGAVSKKTIATDLADISNHATLVTTIMSSLSADASETIFLFAYGTLGDQKAGEKDFAVAEKELRTNFTSVASLLTHIITAVSATDYKPPVTLAVISSVAGDRGRQSNYIYGTAKGALSIWLSGLRNRLAREHSTIHVLTIKPGFVDTPMTSQFKKGLLWVQPEVVAKGIVNAIKNKRDVVYVPWFWRYILIVIKLIPEKLFKQLGL